MAAPGLPVGLTADTVRAARVRVLVLLVPVFRLERCGYGPDDLAALIAEQRGATRLVALTPAARRAGLRPGTTATEARALVPEVELLPLDPIAEAEDRAELIRTLGTFSDRIAPLGDDAVVLDVTRLGDEQALAERVVAHAARLGHHARAAVGDDPLAARAAAEWIAPDHGVAVLPPGDGARSLAPLPLAALRPGDDDGWEDLVDALRAVGVETIGQWASLDPAAVVGRYGAAAARLHRVASGRPRPVRIEHPADPGRPSVWVAMAGATTRQELGFVLPGLLAELSAVLAERDRAAVRLRIVLRLEPIAGTPQATAGVVVRVGRATRSVRTLDRLIRARLDRLTVESPIDELGIEVIESAPEAGWQPGLAARTEAGEPLPDLLARLADQLGEGALFTPIPTAEWRPEAAWRPTKFPRPVVVGRRLRARADPADPVEVLEQREHDHPLPRPTLLLPTPERIELALDGDRPVRVRLGAGWFPIRRSQGPERLTGGWWEPAPLDREYWAIEADGRAAWVYRDPAGGWWLHGWFD